MARPMDNGTVEIVDVQRNVVVGYGYTEDSATPDAQQVQRWVLYADYNAPPSGAVLFRQPLDPVRRYTRLNDWAQALMEGGLWRAGSRYVKAGCTSYDAIDSIPARNPQQQLDCGACSLSQGDVVAGAVFTSGAFGYKAMCSAGETSEHWVLFDKYASPLSAPLLVGPPMTNEAAPTLDAFLTQMKAAWKPGYTYVICTCASFSALPDPL
jgi:hypothetical protein